MPESFPSEEEIRKVVNENVPRPNQKELNNIQAEIVEKIIGDGGENENDPEFLVRVALEISYTMCDEIRKARNLIHWLALPWQSNDPDFAAYDKYGHDLSENVELEETWFEVVRGGVLPQRHVETVKVVCPTCRGQGTVTVAIPEGTQTFQCTVCDGVGTLDAQRSV